MLRVVVFIGILVLIVYSFYFIRETWVVFDGKSMLSEYKKQGIVIKQEKGMLSKCSKHKHLEHCDTVIYKHPFNQTNNRQSAILSNDKASTSRLLMLKNIRCPHFARFDKMPTIDECRRILQAYGVRFPAVVKPIDGTQGYGVHLNVQNCNEVLKIIRELRSNGRTRITVEEQVEGNNYRVFVYNGRVFDVVQRTLASVVGDGRRTLQELIDERNRRQRVQKLYQTHNINWIYIHEQVNSVPKSELPNYVVRKGQRLYITNVANFSNGCNTHRIPLDNVSDTTKTYFVKVNTILGLQMSGIDYMSKDIQNVPAVKGWVIEVNAQPGLEMHQKALPIDTTLTRRFVRGLF